ncbi:MAG: sporulation protein YqfD [Faecousia sp.]
MDFWHSINGLTEVEAVSGDTAALLSALHGAQIAVFDAVFVDELTVRFSVKRQDLKKVKKIVSRRGDEWKRVSRKGFYWTIKNLFMRPVLVVGIGLLLLFGAFVPTRVFFVRVEGNESVPSRKIIEEAAACGIGFGASRREVRSEKMKNALLEAMPELQWAGVNTAGCVATITVRERQITQEPESVTGVSSIVAARDGVILSCTVTRGNGICKVGQAVKAGEVLVSGYTDCGLSIRATRAQAEVYAITERNLTAVTPEEWVTRTGIKEIKKQYALIFQKKRINLYFDSGISDSSCGRMYEENYVVLPGGFQLPIAIVTEVWISYEEVPTVLEEKCAAKALSAFAGTYLSGQMIAGTITEKEETCTLQDGVYCLQGQYACQEMIGRVRSEEIVKPYGEND